jgi:dUTP pyrophosphatase
MSLFGDTPEHMVCKACGRKLTDHVSRVRGVGPVCGGRPKRQRVKRSKTQRQAMGLFDGKGETVEYAVGNRSGLWVYETDTHTLFSERQLKAPKVGDAGIDLPSNALDAVTVRPGYPARIRTGVRWEAKPGIAGMVCPRSGLAYKFGITVVNSPGIVDAGYDGEIMVILATHGRELEVRPGDRVAQFVVTPTVAPAVPPDGTRGADGFGSTGV